jgi:uncharacterized alpha-E superfamily protein
LSKLLSRYAEAIFWMARYVERAENLARVLDVNETFSRDSRGGQNWRSVLQLYSDEDAFFAGHDAATAEAVIHFYLIDRDNPGSILSAVRMARENARTLRPLISTEMWTHLNIFYNRMRDMRPEDLSEPRLARLCGFIKETCQAHTGITEGTFYRDEGWNFYQLGRNLERADQTTRLLDVKYHLLLPSSQVVGMPTDVSQWNAVLRSASGYHAFRRVHPSGMSPAAVSGFLLFHKSFPRSLMACVQATQLMLLDLRRHYDVAGGAAAMARLNGISAELADGSIDRIFARGLHEFLDWTQQELIAITQALGRELFGVAPEEPAEGQGSTPIQA